MPLLATLLRGETAGPGSTRRGRDFAVTEVPLLATLRGEKVARRDPAVAAGLPTRRDRGLRALLARASDSAAAPRTEVVETTERVEPAGLGDTGLFVGGLARSC